MGVTSAQLSPLFRRFVTQAVDMGDVIAHMRVIHIAQDAFVMFSTGLANGAGMGFRITAEIGRLGLPMIWAEIAVAALAGSAFYGVVALIEKRVTFWHPSQRRQGTE